MISIKNIDINAYNNRTAQKQLDGLKLKMKESLDKEKFIPKINQHAKKLRDANRDKDDILGRMKDREKERYKAVVPVDKNVRQDDETQRDFLVRTGKITPFDNLPEYHINQREKDVIFPGSGQMSHQNLHVPIHKAEQPSTSASTPLKRKLNQDDDDYNDAITTEDDEDEYQEEGESENDSVDGEEHGKNRAFKKLDEIYDDDGSELNYRKRLQDWTHNRKIMRYQKTHVKAMITFKS